MYLIYLIIALLIILMLLLNYYKPILNNKITKILSVVYVIIVFLTILLPDGFIKSVDDPSELQGFNKWHAVLRIFLAINPIVIIISVFFENKTFRHLLIFFSLPVNIISTFFYKDFLNYYVDPSGKGLLKINGLSENFKAFLLNDKFRMVILSIEWILFITISLKILLTDKPYKDFKIKDIIKESIILLCLLIQMMPIYVPQILFEGYGHLLFDKFTPLHFIWILYIFFKIIVLWLIFKNKTKTDKYILCLVLAISVLFQYNSMFSLTINIKRLPLQLCNIASYLMLASLFFKNKAIFNFNFLVNVTGATIAILVPDVKGYNLLEVWNLHFIYEHTNVIVVPILSLLFGLFDMIDLKSYRDAVVGFTCYFIIVLILGTIFNHLGVLYDKSSFKANYLFMFDIKVASSTLPFLNAFGNFNIKIGEATLYPLLMLFAYFGYLFIVTIVFIPFYLKNRKYKLKRI